LSNGSMAKQDLFEMEEKAHERSFHAALRKVKKEERDIEKAQLTLVDLQAQVTAMSQHVQYLEKCIQMNNIHLTHTTAIEESSPASKLHHHPSLPAPLWGSSSSSSSNSTTPLTNHIHASHGSLQPITSSLFKNNSNNSPFSPHHHTSHNTNHHPRLLPPPRHHHQNNFGGLASLPPLLPSIMAKTTVAPANSSSSSSSASNQHHHAAPLQQQEQQLQAHDASINQPQPSVATPEATSDHGHHPNAHDPNPNPNVAVIASSSSSLASLSSAQDVELARFKMEHYKLKTRASEAAIELEKCRERVIVARAAVETLILNRNTILPRAREWWWGAYALLAQLISEQLQPQTQEQKDEARPLHVTQHDIHQEVLSAFAKHAALSHDFKATTLTFASSASLMEKLLLAIPWTIETVALLHSASKPSYESLEALLNQSPYKEHKKELASLRHVLIRMDAWTAKSKKSIAKWHKQFTLLPVTTTATNSQSKLDTVLNEYMKLPLTCTWGKKLEQFKLALETAVAAVPSSSPLSIQAQDVGDAKPTVPVALWTLPTLDITPPCSPTAAVAGGDGGAKRKASTNQATSLSHRTSSKKLKVAVEKNIVVAGNGSSVDVVVSKKKDKAAAAKSGKRPHPHASTMKKNSSSNSNSTHRDDDAGVDLDECPKQLEQTQAQQEQQAEKDDDTVVAR
jgi:hypothetical protein